MYRDTSDLNILNYHQSHATMHHEYQLGQSFRCSDAADRITHCPVLESGRLLGSLQRTQQKTGWRKQNISVHMFFEKLNYVWKLRVHYTSLRKYTVLFTNGNRRRKIKLYHSIHMHFAHVCLHSTEWIPSCSSKSRCHDVRAKKNV